MHPQHPNLRSRADNLHPFVQWVECTNPSQKHTTVAVKQELPAPGLQPPGAQEWGGVVLVGGPALLSTSIQIMSLENLSWR